MGETNTAQLQPPDGTVTAQDDALPATQRNDQRDQYRHDSGSRDTHDPDDRHRGDDWRMLHPAALIVGVIRSLKSTIGILLAIVGYRIIRDGWSQWILVGAAALILTLAVVPPAMQWLTTRYRLGADSLEFRTGLFSRKHRTIGYGAIHAINSASPVYFQPFGVVRLTITAAGSDADITLDAVPVALQLELEKLRAASCAARDADSAVTRPTSADGANRGTDDLRPSSPNVVDLSSQLDGASQSSAPSLSSQPNTTNLSSRPSAASGEISPPQPRITQSTSPAAAPAPISSTATPQSTANRPVFRASIRDILLFAVTDLGFLAAALAVYAAFDRVSDLIPRAWMRTATQSVDAIVAQGILSIILLILACVIALMIVSIASALLRFYGFEVWRRGDDLVVVRGLFTRRTVTLPVSRIQTIAVRQSLLRQPFGLCSVTLGLSSAAAGSSDDAKENNDSSNILPVVSTRRVTAILRAMLPEWDVRDAADRPIRHTGRGLTRYYVTLPIVSGLAAIAATIAIMLAMDWVGRWWAWLAVIAVALMFARWAASRWLRSQVDGYALLDAPNAMGTMGTADAPAPSEDGRGTSPDDTSAADMGGGHHVPASAALCSHRIAVTGATGLTRLTLVTRRSRVQSIIRKSALWRESRGVETLLMPLFVTTGSDELRFQFIRQADADRIAAWTEGDPQR
ncbi:PH domain-containing protein [Bifidobacterium sp. SO1]|uniref:PH domain-containing protein n=1 Tax=Bifidobacterium sp. SO1 TaxID=2809029 RepID=UPI001BDC8F4A|nr:PH domain-containing protein [Bifidobacterium sp. SO1]MBT1160650.1 PH domain-containing protein [Bifidobacterium sp. SO1]